MTNKHTEGPWIYDDTWGLIMADNGAVEVAACHAGRGGDAKANARLIAAAPELLDTLENAAEVIENLLEKILPKDDKEREAFLNNNTNDEFLQLTGTLSDIDNAIDKAKGEL